MGRASDQILVIGGGLLGLTSALALIEAGFRVTVIEKQSDVGLGASFANGATLTPSMSDPWNFPGVHRTLIRSLFQPTSPVALRPAALPSLVAWGIRFLANSTPARHRASTRQNFRLARYSLHETQRLQDRFNLDFESRKRGVLRLFRNAGEMAAPLAVAEMLAPEGLDYKILDAGGAAAAEPQLSGIREQIAGAIHYPIDETGDAHLFCQALKQTIRRLGGEILCGTEVCGIQRRGSRVTGVSLTKGDLPAERVVVAAAHASPSLLSDAGLCLPVKPVKGYSITIDTAELGNVPTVPVVDETLHGLITPLDGRLRIAGTAEFAGPDTRIRPERIAGLLSLLGQLYPHIRKRVRDGAVSPWAGLRPMSADGRPFIGETGIGGLYLNTGHGHLGWTMAAGSAKLLADLVTGSAPAIEPAPFRATRAT
ncbi:MAG: D-amino acid dehydrogenase [Sphingomonadales bacterium]|nr:D-amino acid dehydrogenase [Sphingomonadales bacterium]